MGCFYTGSDEKWYRDDKKQTNPTPIIPPNPNPLNYKIKSFKKIGNYLIVEVNYPNCTTFEGNKILIYENISLDDLIRQMRIDPHISDKTDIHYPIIRISPNKIKEAISIVNHLNVIEKE